MWLQESRVDETFAPSIALGSTLTHGPFRNGIQLDDHVRLFEQAFDPWSQDIEHKNEMVGQCDVASRKLIDSVWNSPGGINQ